MKKYSTEELKIAYSKAKELTNKDIKNVVCIGVLFEPDYDISIYQDKMENYYFSCYYVGD